MVFPPWNLDDQPDYVRPKWISKILRLAQRHKLRVGKIYQDAIYIETRHKSRLENFVLDLNLHEEIKSYKPFIDMSNWDNPQPVFPRIRPTLYYVRVEEEDIEMTRKESYA